MPDPAATDHKSVQPSEAKEKSLRPSAPDHSSSANTHTKRHHRHQQLATSKGHEDSEFTLRLLATSGDAGLVIGRGGHNVKSTQQQSGAWIVVSKSGTPDRVIRISGTVKGVSKAVNLIAIRMEEDELKRRAQEEGSKESEKEQDNNWQQYPLTMNVLVPNQQCGAVIGTKGCVIQDIQDKSGARIIVSNELLPSSTDKKVIIKGKATSVSNAIYQISLQLLENPIDDRYIRPYSPGASLDYHDDYYPPHDHYTPPPMPPGLPPPPGYSGRRGPPPIHPYNYGPPPPHLPAGASRDRRSAYSPPPYYGPSPPGPGHYSKTANVSQGRRARARDDSPYARSSRTAPPPSHYHAPPPLPSSEYDYSYKADQYKADPYFGQPPPPSSSYSRSDYPSTTSVAPNAAAPPSTGYGSYDGYRYPQQGNESSTYPSTSTQYGSGAPAPSSQQQQQHRQQTYQQQQQGQGGAYNYSSSAVSTHATEQEQQHSQQQQQPSAYSNYYQPEAAAPSYPPHSQQPQQQRTAGHPSGSSSYAGYGGTQQNIQAQQHQQRATSAVGGVPTRVDPYSSSAAAAPYYGVNAAISLPPQQQQQQQSVQQQYSSATTPITRAVFH